MGESIIDVSELSKTYRVRELGNAPFIKRFFSKKKYREVKALDRVSLVIRQSEFVGLIGNNGAGKSTLIKLLTGILYRSGGEIEVMGRDPFKQRLKNNQEIGVVFGQRVQLNWDLSPMDSFKLLKRIYDISDETFKLNINTFSELFGMETIMSQPVRTLSLGQRMQCEIAAAFLHNPRIVFLDEPTIGLDVFSKEAITKFLCIMKDTRETTLILTTHDLEEMCKICDRAIVLNKGEILFEDRIDSLIAINNQQKKVIFTTEDENADLAGLENGICITRQPHRIICEKIDRNAVHNVITRVTERCFVTDVNIEESNFTDIIKEHLRGIR